MVIHSWSQAIWGAVTLLLIIMVVDIASIMYQSGWARKYGKMAGDANTAVTKALKQEWFDKELRAQFEGVQYSASQLFLSADKASKSFRGRRQWIQEYKEKVSQPIAEFLYISTYLEDLWLSG